MNAADPGCPALARRDARRSPPRVAVLLALAALLSCSQGRDAPQERLAIAALRQPATALYLVARDAGCFDEVGLAVTERTFELGRDALASMLEGAADVAIAYETPTVRAAAWDPRLRVLSKLHTSTRNTRLVARRDRGITGFSSLAGKRVGFASGSNADFFLDLVLRFAGVSRSEVAAVGLSPEVSVGALARGDLDAAVLSDPYAATAEKALGDVGLVLQTDLYTEVSLLLTRDDVVRGREEALRRLARGLACAERMANERPGEAVQRIRGRFPEVGDAELTAQRARVRWELGLDHVLLGVLRDESVWLRVARGVEGPALDTDVLVERRVLEQVLPDAVMLLPGRRVGP